MRSSSRKKSTSKKKSSKLSSKVRSMKKSKKTRSRKRGHRHDTSSNDDSVSSFSISSPSDSYSDSDSMSPHPRRRSIKKREKRSHKTSSHKKDNRDSKKRKKSKKNGDLKPRKKLKRDVKISSASSDSHNCSTFNDSFTDSERSEGERVKKRSREQKKGERDGRKEKSVSPLSFSQSPSPSFVGYQKEKSVSPLSSNRSPSPSFVGYRDEIQTISQSEETFSTRRLKSVIVIPEKLTFEELVDDHDDYPYKSSSGEGGKKGSTPSPLDSSAYGQSVENDGFPSDVNGMSELAAKRIEVERVSETRELEAILKQQALENLKKFRGARKTSVKPTADQLDANSGDRNGSDSLETEIDKNKLSQLADSTVSDRDFPSGEFSKKVLGATKQRSSEAPVLNKPVTGSSSFRRTSSGMDPALKQTKPPLVSADKTCIETESSLSNPEPKMITRQKSQGTAGSSALADNVENPSSNNEPDHYEHGTMSVMRGGEMVEVKYKIKKPTRAPRKFN